MQRRRPNDIEEISPPFEPLPSPRTEYGVKSLDSTASFEQQQPFSSGMLKQVPTFAQRKRNTLNAGHTMALNGETNPDKPSPPVTSAATWTLQGNHALEHNMDLVVPRMTIHERSKSSLALWRDHEIGFLRLIVCGDSGIGKSALIYALSMLPEINAFDTSDNRESVAVQSFMDDFEESLHEEKIPYNKDTPDTIRETYVSSMPTPSWGRRHYQDGDIRKDTNTPLHNICFIDTPGYGAFLDASAAIAPVTQYLEAQFHRSNRMIHPDCSSNEDLAKLFHNRQGSHTHVDACLYLIMGRLKKVDVEYLRSIQKLCNIVPVIVKSDLLSTDQEKELKLDVLQELRDHNIDYFDFGYSYDELEAKATKLDPSVPPFAISSLNGNHPRHEIDGADNQHTSLSSRTASARKSRISFLKDALFYEHVEHLRRSTSNKFVQWRSGEAAVSHTPSIYPKLDIPTQITRESMDRIHSVRDQKLQKVSLQISRYLSEPRKSRLLDHTTLVQQRDHGQETQTQGDILFAELANIFHEATSDVPSSASISSNASSLIDSSQRKSKSSSATSRTSRTLSISSASMLFRPTVMDIKIMIFMFLCAVITATLGVYIFTWTTRKADAQVYQSPSPRYR